MQKLKFVWIQIEAIGIEFKRGKTDTMLKFGIRLNVKFLPRLTKRFNFGKEFFKVKIEKDKPAMGYLLNIIVKYLMF